MATSDHVTKEQKRRSVFLSIFTSSSHADGEPNKPSGPTASLAPSAAGTRKKEKEEKRKSKKEKKKLHTGDGKTPAAVAAPLPSTTAAAAAVVVLAAAAAASTAVPAEARPNGTPAPVAAVAVVPATSVPPATASPPTAAVRGRAILFGPEPEQSWPPQRFHLFAKAMSQLEYYDLYGPVYGVKILGANFFVIAEPDLVKEIGSSPSMWGKLGSEQSPIFSQWHNIRGNRGISVIDDGEQYQKIRGVLLNFYNPKNWAQHLLPKMVELAKELAGSWVSHCRNQHIDLREWFTRYAVEVAAAGAFSCPFHSLSPPDVAKPKLAQLIPQCLREATGRAVSPPPESAKTQAFLENCAFVRDEVATVLRARQSAEGAAALSPAASTKPPPALAATTTSTTQASTSVPSAVGAPSAGSDLVQVLLNKADPVSGQKLSFDEMHHQLLVQLSNGFNGPSIVCTWAVYLLSQHPECEDQLVREVDEINGAEGHQHTLTARDLDQMPYTTAVLKETLRLFPPFPISLRHALQDGKLGPYAVQRGDTVLVAALSMHRQPALFADPETFDPDRFFLPERASKVHPGSYVPFSVGQRQCMAQQASFMIMKTLLWAMYSRLRFRLKPGANVQIAQALLLSPTGIEVSVHPRLAFGSAGPAARAAKVTFLHHDPAAAKEPKRRPAAPRVAASSPNSKLQVVVLYGTTFGTCQSLAERLRDQAVEFGFATPAVHAMNDYLPKLAALQPGNENLVLIVTSTYTGLPANTANAFGRWIGTDAARAGVKHLRFAVFGVGNSQWTTYQAFPTEISDKFTALSADQIFELGRGDVAVGDWESSFFDWSRRLWDLLTASTDGPSLSKQASKARLLLQRSLTQLASLSVRAPSGAEIELFDRAADTVVAQLATPLKQGSFEVVVSRADELQPKSGKGGGAGGSTRLLEVVLPDGVSYEVGDHLGLCPANDPAEVRRVAERLRVDLQKVFRIDEGLASKFRHLPVGTVLSVENVLSNLLDGRGPPSRTFLAMLAATATDPRERARLQLLASNTPEAVEALQSSVTKRLLGVFDLVFEFKSAAVTFQQFVQFCPLIRPRYYSISSSPTKAGQRPGACQITCGLLRLPTGDPQRTHVGFCSGYVNRLQLGQRLHVFINPAMEFHLPADLTQPIVMIGAGTGLAPFIGYMEQLRQAKQRGVVLGENALFFGCRKSAEDYIYKQEIAAFLAEGVVKHVAVAFSRDDPAKVHYVQHIYREHSKLVWQLIKEGAFVYVCGSKQMRADVKAATAEIVAKESGMNAQETAINLLGLWASKHYVEDVWG